MIQFVLKVAHMARGESTALRTDKAGGCVWSQDCSVRDMGRVCTRAAVL